MAMLSTSTMVARGIGFATMPVLTRIYTPDHFGILSVFASTVALLVPFGTLRFSAAVPLPESNTIAANILVLSFLSIISVSLFFLFFFLACGPAFLERLSIGELAPYWWLVILGLIGAGLFEILTAWGIREKRFSPLAKARVWQSVLSDLAKIGLGLLGLRPIGLLLGHVVSQAGGGLSLSLMFFPKIRSYFKRVSVKRLTFVFKRYIDFPKFRLPSQFLLAFSVNAPLLFSAALFGKETTGQLGLALTTLALPIVLFGNTTGQAYYAEIARIGPKNPEKIREITKSVTKKLFFTSLPPFFILLLAGPRLFVFVFGDAWRDAGVFASGLAIYLLTQFVSAPLTNILNVFDKQLLFLKINITRALLLLLVFGGAYHFDIRAVSTIFTYGYVLAFHYTIVSILIIRVIK